jgi:hypothetical protein
MGYHDEPGINFSTLKHMRESPRAYMRARLAGISDSPAFSLGRLTHTLTLEPGKFSEKYSVIDLSSRRSRAWDDHATKAIKEGKEPALLRDVKHAQRSADAVFRHDVAGRMVENARAKFEQAIFWEAEGFDFALKSQIDLVVPGAFICDLKTTSEIAVDKWMHKAAQYDYLAQFAMYQDAWQAVTCEQLPFRAIVVDSRVIFSGDRDQFTDDPHFAPDVFVVSFDSEDLEIGRSIYRGWLEELKQCEERDAFPGVAPNSVLPYRRPAWYNGPEPAVTMGGIPLEV